MLFCRAACVSHLPATHFNMSGPGIMLSGQTQVNFGERSLIWGAGRQRNSQEDTVVHQFVPAWVWTQHTLDITEWSKCFIAYYNQSNKEIYCTIGLFKIVVHYDVLRLLQVPSNLSDVSSCQAVGTKNSTVVYVCPEHFLLLKQRELMMIY